MGFLHSGGEMHIYVIRHGQRADADPNYCGGTNPPLSVLGEKQAAALGRWFEGRQVDALYSSCMLRALQTAQPLQRLTGLPQQVWPVFCETTTLTWKELIEQDPDRARLTLAWRNGETWDDEQATESEKLAGDYYRLSEIPQRFPGTELTQPFDWPDCWWMALRGGSRETAYARIELGAQALLARHSDSEHIVVVCHGNSGDMLMTCLLGLERFQGRRFSTANSSVNLIQVTHAGVRRMHLMNYLDHLPVELRA